MCVKQMKKTAIALSLVCATTFGYSPRSEAIVGIASWNPVLMGAGLAGATFGYIVGVGAGFGVQSAFEHRNYLVKALGAVGAIVSAGGIITCIVGQIVLPDGTTSMEFEKITPDVQRKLKLSSFEVASFNNELDQVNFITQQVAVDLSRIEKPTLDDSVNAWNQYADMVSPATLKVMGTSAVSMFKK